MPDDETPLITTAADLDELVAHLRAAGRFAFDTEFVSEETYEPVLGLIQVATRERVAAVDPLAVGGVGPLWEVVTDPAVEVVMHAAGEDLRICRWQSGRLPARVVDVQIAAGLAGHGYPLSLSNLVRAELGVTLAGGETRTDWRRRPLTPAQLRYALDDVLYLLEVADRLGERLASWGRVEWAEGEYRAQVETVGARHEDEDRWRRIPGVNGLSRRGLELARRLDAWRRESARRDDRPLRHVLRDDVLVSIARRQPASRRDLEALRDVQRSPVLAQARAVLEVIAEGLAVPEAGLPRHAPRHQEGPGLAMVVSLLQAALGRCCAEHRLAASLVGTSQDLKDLVRWQAEGCPPGRRPPLASGWRGEVCGGTLLDVLEGRCALRISDPASDVPVGLVRGSDAGGRP